MPLRVEAAAIVAANAAADTLAAPEAVADLFDYFSELIERRRVHDGRRQI